MKRLALLEGIDFSVRMNPAYFKGKDDKHHAFPNRFSIIREDNGEPLSIVGSEYKPQDHRENLVMVAKVLDKISPGYEVSHTMQGARIYTKFNLSNQLVMARSTNERANVIVNVLNSYDGSASLKIALSLLRQICTNGMMGLVEAFKIKKIHSRNLELGGLVTGLSGAIEEQKKVYVKLYNALKDRKPIEFPVLKEKLPQKLVEEAMPIYKKDGIMSAWGQYNAFTNVISHRDVSENRREVLQGKVASYFTGKFSLN